MRDGISIYKCGDCNKRTSPDASLVVIQGASSADGMGSSGPVVELVTLLNTLVAKVDNLTAEVKSLKAENASMKNELSKTNALLSKRSDAVNRKPAQRGPNYSEVAQRHVEVPRRGAPPAQRFGPSTHRYTAPPADVQPTGLPNGSDSTSRLPSSEAGWTRVGRLGNRDALVGANKSTKIATVARGPVKKALFVSRLHPDTSSDDITNLLSGVVTDKELTCTRLKSKYSSYASFHISLYKSLNPVSPGANLPKHQHSDGQPGTPPLQNATTVGEGSDDRRYQRILQRRHATFRIPLDGAASSLFRRRPEISLSHRPGAPLLNFDYKVLASVLARRLRDLLPWLVSPLQL
ncbi:hypothetical protein HPB47_018513 [Ixodes persulcatus]|uniref:Uncharacterized protein n=1 Tax=Ixodes persulcatus TaxID=34615 RepID=A0AC60QKS1_IXOPE|nr:hypothetical protein HPB47_018513 [Ixodes persulcatus]